jgi:hypothetical protein
VGAQGYFETAYEQFGSDETHWLEDYALFRTLITPDVRTLRYQFPPPRTWVLQVAFGGLADNWQVSKGGEQRWALQQLSRLQGGDSASQERLTRVRIY